MPAAIVSRSDTAFIIQVEIPYGPSMLDAEETIQQRLDEAGTLATAEALGRFDTDGSPIRVADTKLTSMGRVLKEYQTPYGVAPVERQDVFHTATEAHPALARQWRLAEPTWAEAEAADATVDRAKEQGLEARGPAGPARAAWRGATAALERVDALEWAWRRARAAFELFRADGRLNDRVAAEAEIAEALEGLTDPEWKKVRNFLLDRRGLAFLDRMHERLARAEPRPEWREAMAWRWRLRHGHPSPAANPMVALMGRVGRHRRLTEPEQGSYDAVAAVLGDTVRASSAVECMNSVLRMQQSRHHRMTQAMLDLKRLYWNRHRFRSGPRKNVCPYQKLGLR